LCGCVCMCGGVLGMKMGDFLGVGRVQMILAEWSVELTLNKWEYTVIQFFVCGIQVHVWTRAGKELKLHVKHRLSRVSFV